MDTQKTSLERAFDLARSGKCIGLADLIRRLTSEGYVARQIEGPHLKKQLAGLIKGAVVPAPIFQQECALTVAAWRRKR